MKWMLLVAIMLIINGCGGSDSSDSSGGGSVPPQPVANPIVPTIEPFDIVMDDFNFPVAGGKELFVTDRYLFGVDLANNGYRQSEAGTWEVLLPYGEYKTVSFFEGTLFRYVDSLTYYSNDDGLSWSLLDSESTPIPFELYDPILSAHLAKSGETLLVSYDTGSTWEELVDAGEFIYDFEKIDETYILMSLVTRDSSSKSALYNIENGETTLFEPQGISQVLNIGKLGDAIVSSNGVDFFASDDGGRTWNTLLNGMSSIEADFISVDNVLLSTDTRELVRFDENLTATTLTPSVYIGAVRDIQRMGDKVFFITDVGLYESALIDVLNDELLTMTEVHFPSQHVGRLLTSGEKDYYTNDSFDSYFLRELNSGASYYAGGNRVESILSETTERIYHGYSRTEDYSIYGLAYVDKINGGVSVIEDFSGTGTIGNSTKRINDSLFPIQMNPQSDLIQPDDTFVPDHRVASLTYSGDITTYQLAGDIMYLSNLGYVSSCEKTLAVAHTESGVSIASLADNDEVSNWVLEAQAIPSFNSALNLEVSPSLQVVWTDSDLWIRSECNGVFTEIDLASEMVGEITSVRLNGEQIFLGTSTGELWKIEGNIAYRTSLPEQSSISQVYVTVDHHLLVTTPTRTYKSRQVID